MKDQHRKHSADAMTRRTLLAGMGAGASILALGSGATGWASAARAASPGSNPGKYKVDLGGYNGPELTSEPVTLRFMRQDFAPNVNAVFETAYAEFTKAYPNITVQEEKVPYGDLQNKVQVYVSAGSAPDIMMGRNDFAQAYAAGQFAAPLQDYLSPSYVEDLLDAFRASAIVDGQLVCLPWEAQPVLMYVNHDLFEQAGVEAPPEVTDLGAAWTWEQFNTALDGVAKALRAQGAKDVWAFGSSPFGNGGPGSNYAQLESIWIRSLGDPEADKTSTAYRTYAGVSEDGLTASGYLDTPEAINGMENYKYLFANGLSPKGAVANQFQSGVAATELAGIQLSATLRQDANVKFKWGVSPVPRGAIDFTANVADSPFVFAGSPHVAEAAALLAFICNDANRTAFHREWGSLPSRKSLLDSSQYQDQPDYRLASIVAQAAYPPPRTIGWFDYYNAVNPAVKDIALGADPAKTLHAVAQRIDGLLAKYK
jgi:multiple sugar transport system substrate-binding protein